MAKREDWLKNKRVNYHSHLSEIIQAVNAGNFSKLSKYESELILKWDSIFDRKIADKTSFLKLVFDSRTSENATLHVNVNPDDILEFVYYEGIMLEQLANYFGYKFVSKIRYVKDHSFSKGKNDGQKQVASQNKSNKMADEKVAQQINQKISDERLQKTFEELYKNLK